VLYASEITDECFAQFYHYFGSICFLENQLQTAIQCFHWSRVVFEKLRIVDNMHYFFIAYVNFNLGELSASEWYFHKALEITIANWGSESEGIVGFHLALASICTSAGKGEEAIEHCVRAIAVLESHPSEENDQQALMYRRQLASLQNNRDIIKRPS